MISDAIWLVVIVAFNYVVFAALFSAAGLGWFARAALRRKGADTRDGASRGWIDTLAVALWPVTLVGLVAWFLYLCAAIVLTVLRILISKTA
jgi:hypothetical protein